MRWLLYYSTVAYSVHAYTCQESLGVQIQTSDCFNALGQLFGPIQYQLSQSQLESRRQFRLHDLLEVQRMPRGQTSGTCSLAIDITSTRGESAVASWSVLYLELFRLMTACVHDGLKGQGGVSITPDGFVFIVVNPYTIDVANTCMAPLEPRRMDVAQCVLDLAARSAHIANIPQLPPGPSTQAANIPDQQLPNSPPITEEDRDFLATYFGDIDPEGAGAGPASAGPSDGTYAFSNRLLPPAPLATRETQQVINLGNSARTHEVIAGTWWLTKAGWVPAKGRRLWKTCGSWFLLRGIGQPVPFPIGAIPEWNGGVIEYRPRTDAGAIISEAWIEENGRWKPLEGVVPQPGPWLRNGGLLLLRGADGAH